MRKEPTESLATLLRVIDLLEGLGIRYHRGGSFASSIHGIPRQTRDADIVAELLPGHARALVAGLGDGFYADERSIREAIDRRRSFNLVDLATGFKVDVFVKGDGPFDGSEFERATEQVLDPDTSRTVVVKSAEDTVLRKLL